MFSFPLYGPPGKRLHLQRRAHHNQHVRFGKVALGQLKVALGQCLAEEHNVGLHQSAAVLATTHLVDQTRPTHRCMVAPSSATNQWPRAHQRTVHRRFRFARDAVRAAKGAVRFDQQIGRHAGHALQRVDVLSVVAQQQTLGSEQCNEKVCYARTTVSEGNWPRATASLTACWLKRAWKHLFGQRVERFRALAKVVELENRFRERQIVLLQIVVQASAGRATSSAQRVSCATLERRRTESLVCRLPR